MKNTYTIVDNYKLQTYRTPSSVQLKNLLHFILKFNRNVFFHRCSFGEIALQL